MIRRIFQAVFPPRPFPEQDGVLDEMLIGAMERERQREVRTAEALEAFEMECDQ